MADSYPALDFTVPDQRDAEWADPDGRRYRFLDRSTGTGFHRWDDGDWVWSGVMVFDGPYTRVPLRDELGEDADWDEGWEIEA